MTRKATAQWQGGLKDGKGAISTASGVLSSTPYSFHTRFEQGQGTNPEELVAAAHAGCFTMALSVQLGEEGYTAEKIETTAEIVLEKLESGFTITESRLKVTAKIPGAVNEKFQAAAKRAELGCPISKLLKAKISMEAKLES
jgi:osmotically inducible protein OsmC